MVSNPTHSNSYSLPHPRLSSSLSTTSQSDFGAIAKALNFIPIKLVSGNYIFWKAQALATIRAFDLVSLLQKSTPPPKYEANPESSNAEATRSNEDYMNWLRSDQRLLGWLFSTIEREVLTQCESSAEVWSTLKNLYSR